MMSWQARAPWIGALGASLAWPVIYPLIARQRAVGLAPVVIDGGALHAITAQLPAIPPAVSSRLSAALLALWFTASLLLAARLLLAQRALARISRSARAAEIDGHAVLVTEDIGPAVVGIVLPRVAVPAWLAELDEPLRALVLRHEREHCRARDTALLWLGEVAVVLMPWNPAVWWQSRRLRLALELDCDARTVGDPEAASTYGKLLLLIAQRQQMTRLAPMLAESSSHLTERITAMTHKTDSKKPLHAALLGGVAIAAIIAACSNRVGDDLVGPQPTGGRPVAALTPEERPVTSAQQAAGGQAAPGAAAGTNKRMLAPSAPGYFEYQVEKPAMFAQGSPSPRYPDILKMAGVEGTVIASFVVDTTGIPDTTTIRVIKSAHPLFVRSVLTTIPEMRFTAALVGGKKVKQVVMLPFMFQLSDSAKSAQKAAPGILVAPRIP
jgi:TonB family protein